MIENKESWELTDLLLNYDTERNDERQEMFDRFESLAGPHGTKVREFLVSIHNRFNREQQNLEQVNTRNKSAWANLSAMRRTRERDRNYLQTLVRDLPAGDQIDLDGPDALYWFGVIARAGILAGYAGDAERLLRTIRQNGYAHADQAWETASETLTVDGNYPTPVSIEEAVTEAVTHYGQHPLKPELHEFWKYVWRVAKTEAGLCNVFDEMATVLGLPTEWMPTREGYWLFQGSFSVRVYAEDVPADEVPEMDRWDILQAMSADDIEIEEIEED